MCVSSYCVENSLVVSKPSHEDMTCIKMYKSSYNRASIQTCEWSCELLSFKKSCKLDSRATVVSIPLNSMTKAISLQYA